MMKERQRQADRPTRYLLVDMGRTFGGSVCLCLMIGAGGVMGQNPIVAIGLILLVLVFTLKFFSLLREVQSRNKDEGSEQDAGGYR